MTQHKAHRKTDPKLTAWIIDYVVLVGQLAAIQGGCIGFSLLLFGLFGGK